MLSLQPTWHRHLFGAVSVSIFMVARVRAELDIGADVGIVASVVGVVGISMVLAVCLFGPKKKSKSNHAAASTAIPSRENIYNSNIDAPLAVPSNGMSASTYQGQSGPSDYNPHQYHPDGQPLASVGHHAAAYPPAVSGSVNSSGSYIGSSVYPTSQPSSYTATASHANGAYVTGQRQQTSIPAYVYNSQEAIAPRPSNHVPSASPQWTPTSAASQPPGLNSSQQHVYTPVGHPPTSALASVPSLQGNNSLSDASNDNRRISGGLESRPSEQDDLVRHSSGLNSLTVDRRPDWPANLPPQQTPGRPGGAARSVVKPTDTSLDAVLRFVQTLIDTMGGRFGKPGSDLTIVQTQPIKRGKHCVHFQVKKPFARYNWDVLLFPHTAHYERQKRISQKVWFRQFVPEVQDREDTPSWYDEETGSYVECPPYIATLHSVPLDEILSKCSNAATRQNTLEQVARQLIEPIKVLHGRRTCHLCIFKDNIVRLAGINPVWAFRECCAWLGPERDRSWRPLQEIVEPAEIFMLAPEGLLPQPTTQPPLDIWQLGIVLFDMFSRSPYWDRNMTPDDVRAALTTPGGLPHERYPFKFDELGNGPRLSMLSEIIRDMITRVPSARRTIVDVERGITEAFPDSENTIAGHTVYAGAVTGTITLGVNQNGLPAFGPRYSGPAPLVPPAYNPNLRHQLPPHPPPRH